MTAPRPQSALENNVHFWRSQAESLERDRTKLVYPLLLSAPTGALVYMLTHMIYAALAVGLGLFSAWALGLYMVTVRRAEYAFALKEALAQWQAEQAAKAEQDIKPS